MRLLQSIALFDLRVLLWCVKRHHYRSLIPFARGISRSGDGYLLLLVPLMMAVLAPQQGWSFAAAVALATAIELPLYWVLKNSLKRPRPTDTHPACHAVITPADTFSFPSGHSAAAAMLATITLITFGTAATPLLIWAAGVALSRVVLGVHFPSDVIAGALLGSAIGYLATLLIGVLL